MTALVLLVTLLITGAALLALQGVTFVVALKAGKHSVVDTAWGLGIALAALAAFLVSLGHGDPARRALLLAASALWGLRLAIYGRSNPSTPLGQHAYDRGGGLVGKGRSCLAVAKTERGAWRICGLGTRGSRGVDASSRPVALPGVREGGRANRGGLDPLADAHARFAPGRVHDLLMEPKASWETRT